MRKKINQRQTKSDDFFSLFLCFSDFFPLVRNHFKKKSPFTSFFLESIKKHRKKHSSKSKHAQNKNNENQKSTSFLLSSFDELFFRSLFF